MKLAQQRTKLPVVDTEYVADLRPVQVKIRVWHALDIECVGDVSLHRGAINLAENDLFVGVAVAVGEELRLEVLARRTHWLRAAERDHHTGRVFDQFLDLSQVMNYPDFVMFRPPLHLSTHVVRHRLAHSSLIITTLLTLTAAVVGVHQILHLLVLLHRQTLALLFRVLLHLEGQVGVLVLFKFDWVTQDHHVLNNPFEVTDQASCFVRRAELFVGLEQVLWDAFTSGEKLCALVGEVIAIALVDAVVLALVELAYAGEETFYEDFLFHLSVADICLSLWDAKRSFSGQVVANAVAKVKFFTINDEA
jgi:hypothetical protein